MAISAEILKQFTHNNVFVETGMGWGWGIGRALEAGFSRVISIECNEIPFNATHKVHGNNPRVTLIRGDSGEVLGSVLEDIDEPTTLFLDGHWGEVFAKEGGQKGDPCPVLKEIAAIGAHPHKHTILIDDMPEFSTKGLPAWHNITEKEVRKTVLAENPGYTLRYVQGLIRLGKHTMDNYVLVGEPPEE